MWKRAYRARESRQWSRRVGIRAGTLLSLAYFGVAAPGWADQSGAPETVLVGLTQPAREATLGADAPLRLLDIPVKEGARVRQNDVVIQFVDRPQRARAQIARLKAESTLEVELARIRWKQAAEELERLKQFQNDSVTSIKELRDAQAEADVMRVRYEIAQCEHTQASLDYEFQKILVEKLAVRAPFDGYVDEVLHEPQETVEVGEGIVRIVQLDPLQVTLHCPLESIQRIRIGDKIVVTPGESGWDPRSGTVSFVDRVADAGSQTVEVKLIVENPDLDWISGMKVLVQLPGSDPTARSNPRPAQTSAIADTESNPAAKNRKPRAGDS